MEQYFQNINFTNNVQDVVQVQQISDKDTKMYLVQKAYILLRDHETYVYGK